MLYLAYLSVTMSLLNMMESAVKLESWQRQVVTDSPDMLALQVVDPTWGITGKD